MIQGISAGAVMALAMVMGLTGCAGKMRATAGVGSAPMPIEPLAVPAPEALLGLDTAAVENLFGPPPLLRHEAPAEVWQYRTELCVLDLFFYAEADGRHVKFVEARTTQAEATSPAPCLAQVSALHRST